MINGISLNTLGIIPNLAVCTLMLLLVGCAKPEYCDELIAIPSSNIDSIAIRVAIRDSLDEIDTVSLTAQNTRIRWMPFAPEQGQSVAQWIQNVSQHDLYSAKALSTETHYMGFDIGDIIIDSNDFKKGSAPLVVGWESRSNDTALIVSDSDLSEDVQKGQVIRYWIIANIKKFGYIRLRDSIKIDVKQYDCTLPFAS